MLTLTFFQKDMVIDDLYEDLKDGLNLIQLLEILSNKPIVSTNKNIKSETQSGLTLKKDQYFFPF